MTTLHRLAMVPYSAENMYRLIDDIESYPNFLPWCTQTKILEKNDQEIIATIELSAAGMHKSFTTRNKLIPNQRIEMQHVEGPFKHLSGVWTLIPVAKGCQVKLDLEFEVHSGLAGKIFGMLYNKVADKLVESFCEQADKLYGNIK
ncbi:MAG: hypothetical protein A3E87_10185 [Gammaproteobacteria bacterium RIFCSPHIGHO2_12_FULL_35_23]|nr:MAG: hypothetical protein A3E87_10185 [Gammaproteobacteria bacterium RIFCSPHIGHO2_12_FULL_35_23]